MPAVSKTDRDAILQSSLRMLRRSGPASLSLRAVAADLGITPNAIYHHFPNRNALDQALAEEAAHRILRSVNIALRSTHHKQRLAVFAHTYLRFAVRQPSLYDMLMTRSTESCADDQRSRLWHLLLQVTQPHVGERNADEAATSIWSLLHGAVTLGRAGMLGGGTPQQAIAFALAALTRRYPEAPRSVEQSKHTHD